MPDRLRRALLATLAAMPLAASGGQATPPGSGTSTPGVYTLYAAGDIARCAHPDPRWSGAAATAALVEKRLAGDPDAAVLTLGDHTYPRGTAREFADCYAPTWGRFRERTWPTPGNHEYHTSNGSPYFAYFGKRAGRGYYSLRLGSWLVVSLNSNLKGAEHAAQLDWLRAELARAPSRCTLAFWHHPLYTSGGHLGPGRMQDAWEILFEAGAEVVLSGHDHDYERFAPQDAHGRLDRARGIRQFVVGTGGAYATPFLQFPPNSEVREASFDGVLQLRLLDGAVAWQFLPAAPEKLPAGAVMDHGRMECH